MRKSIIISFATIVVLGAVIFTQWQHISKKFFPCCKTCTNSGEKNPVIEKLTIAFADEWIAAYQYWMGAKFMDRPIDEVSKELEQHYKEEMEHANMIAGRIIQLGGTLHMFPKDWHNIGVCIFDAISDYSFPNIVRENLKGEHQAVAFYQDVLKMVEGKDQETYDIVQKILNDELEHVKDLTELLKKLE
jgi:bacterioferritin